MLQEQVEKLNRQNTEHSHVSAEVDVQRGENGGGGGRKQEAAERILNGPHSSAAQTHETKKESQEGEEEEEGDIFEESEEEEEEENLDVSVQPMGKVEDEVKNRHKGKTEESEKAQSIITEICKISLLHQER